MKKILVPTDFSNCSNAALKVAISIAKKNDAEIEILHVIESPEFQYPTLDFTAIPASYFSEIKKELFEQADKKLKKLEETAHMFDVRIGAHVEEGMMYQVLEDISESGSFDLIVLGTTGATGLAESLIGSNAQKVVRYSKTPVITVSHAMGEFDLKKVMIASDFKETDKMQLDLLTTFLNKDEIEVHLVGVTTPLDPEEKSEVEKRILDFADHANLDSYESEILYNKDIVRAITEHSKKVDSDLILMYTHGYTGIKQWFHNSIAESVVNHANLPVLTLKFDQ